MSCPKDSTFAAYAILPSTCLDSTVDNKCDLTCLICSINNESNTCLKCIIGYVKK